MKISWTPSASNDGTPIIGYLLEYKQQSRTDWVKDNFNKSTDTSSVVKSLKENTEYEFRVYALNEVGLSDSSPVTEMIRTIGTSLVSVILVNY